MWSTVSNMSSMITLSFRLVHCSDFVTNRYGESWETMSPKLKMLGPLCNQTVNLKTDFKTLYYSLLKLKYSPSILKHNKG